MQFIYLNTRSGLIKRVLELQEELSEYKGCCDYYKEEYKRVVKEKADQDDFIISQEDEIKHLQQQLEHEKETKENNFTIPQINADVWKMIRYKTFPETHKCTEECFVEHILPAIQRDYDSINPKYKGDIGTINTFLCHWEERLKETYNFIDCLYIGVDGKIKVWEK